MTIDWGYWLGQSTWTLVLGICGAALFEWVVRPNYLKAFGTESQRRRAAERDDRVFAMAAKFGVTGAMMRLARMIVLLPPTFAVALAVAVITGLAFPKEQFIEFRPAIRTVASLAIPLLAGAIFYLTIRILTDVQGAIMICRSFDNTVTFLEPVATRTEVLELRSNFVAMRSRRDAVAINQKFLEIANRTQRPIPWADEFYLEDN